MTDTTLNRYVCQGTAAQRAAFTPAPATPGSGPALGIFWFETDTNDTYAWNSGGSAWVLTTTASSGTVSNVSLTSSDLTVTGSPITSSGTMTLALPASGAAAGSYTKVTVTAKGLVTAGASATLASADFVNQGTTATVLHGNAAGNPSWAAVTNTVTPPGRLTLTSGTPITTADVTAATNIYYLPYLGNLIQLWDGSAWTLYTFAELTLALGTLTSGKPYDVFVFESSGTVTLEVGPVWTNDTTRATAVTLQDGRYCKSGDKTRLYLGTFYTTSTTTTEDSVANRYLANFYNTVDRSLSARPGYSDNNAANTITTASATWVRVNGGTNDLVSYVLTRPQMVSAVFAARGVPSGATAEVYLGICPDNTTAGATLFCSVTYGSTGLIEMAIPKVFLQTEGRHFLQMMFQSSTGTATYYSDGGRLAGSSADSQLSGLTASIQG